MSEEKFLELVNLYLDREISEQGLADLKAELEANLERKLEFQERCRLNQAMRLAMSPCAVSKRRSGRSSSRVESSSFKSTKSTKSKRTKGNRVKGKLPTARAARTPHTLSSVSSVSSVSDERRRVRRQAALGARQQRELMDSGRPQFGDLPVSTQEFAGDKGHFPRWIMGAGLAASFVIGFVLLAPALRDTVNLASRAALEGIESDQELQMDPLDTIGRSEWRRYATTQAQRSANQRASIAAQLRLMGLRPELTPVEKQLRSVSAAAARRPAPARNDAELLAAVQQMSPMPTPQILRVQPTDQESSMKWPSGFHSSLASFK
ncbi:hypothetical protein QEH59_03540 [Coraliomargarita sp. SDUM461004]|uniref:Anti sigma-E protein RseA N-terminal domain-containing protein n=1 Tax=Thalassobacterium sedimentorum TaxID=3041258 RepID=A0ABU1AFF0_9BACT|nr:hypothetical protein [Coraliomargarita sp. SDUM461004]MDQ8193483.1 hypothetical protein [Coraliomargarita sp. SDUM461004]